MEIEIGDMVRVQLSDAPVFTARVKSVQPDQLMGTAYQLLPPGRSPIWVSAHRILAVIENFPVDGICHHVVCVGH